MDSWADALVPGRKPGRNLGLYYYFAWKGTPNFLLLLLYDLEPRGDEYLVLVRKRRGPGQ